MLSEVKKSYACAEHREIHRDGEITNECSGDQIYDKNNAVANASARNQKP